MRTLIALSLLLPLAAQAQTPPADKRDVGDVVTQPVADVNLKKKEIPPEDRVALFEDFVQGHRNRHEERGGFGLGLGSARKMAVLMEGTAGLDARWQKGSAFYLELPAG